MEVDPRNICTSQINNSSDADSLQISSKADIVFRIKYQKLKIEQVQYSRLTLKMIIKLEN